MGLVNQCVLGGGCASRKGDLRDKKDEGWGGSVGYALRGDQHIPLLLAAHIYTPGMSLLFLPAIVYRSKYAI